MSSPTPGLNNARQRARSVTPGGSVKAFGYLVGEKLLNYIRASDSDPSWAEKLPLFVAEVQQIFTAEELRGYFATTTRVGPGSARRDR